MATDATLVTLFADISGSTRLYEVLGDAAAHAIVAECLSTMTSVTTGHGGSVLRTVGDEVLATFPDADSAVAGAVALHEAIRALGRTLGEALTIRVAFQYGPVLQDGGDVYGDAVNTAARLVRQAKASEILTTGPTVARMTGRWKTASRLITWMEVRGKQEPLEVYEVVWQPADATMPSAQHHPPPAQTGLAGLVLIAEGARVVLDAARPAITLGREEKNDLIVTNTRVSRNHARLEFRHGRVMLYDHSSNGTYLLPHGASTIFLHRDGCELFGGGAFGLGEDPLPDSSARVRYEPVL